MKNSKNGGTGVGIVLIMLAIVWIAALVITAVRANYTFEKHYLYAWNLADKSSSIPAKSELITQFVNTLISNRTDFADNNAVFLRTPDNSFDNNLKALTTLRDRMEDIKRMDPTSFQYNTAIEQITKQEQGEAHNLIGVIQGCYDLEKYPIVWGWIGALSVICLIIMLVIGIGIIINDNGY